MAETLHAQVVPFDAEASGIEDDETGSPINGRAYEEAERVAEALVFASADPVSEKEIKDKIADEVDVRVVMERLAGFYSMRGVNLQRVGDHWAFRTASDLSFLINRDRTESRRLSRAALEVLAIISYHQPVTRAEIEEIRGVATSRGTLDVLLESGWVKMRGRRRAPGRPVTYGTTLDFLDHFGLEDLRDLPGLEELKGAGLLSSRIPSNFQVPVPPANDDLADDEDPMTQMDLEELGLLTPMGDGDE